MDPMSWPRLKQSTLPGNYPLYPDESAVEAIRGYLVEIPPEVLDVFFQQNDKVQRRNRGSGKVEYSMKDADGNLMVIVQIDEGKPQAFVPTRDTEEDGDTLVYKWVSQADLDSMNKRNVTNRKSRRRRSRKQRRSTRRN